jgi:hypothetical protein
MRATPAANLRDAFPAPAALTRAGAIVALALGVITAASAATWKDFGPAFRPFPCQDGWAACLAGTLPVGPDLIRDSAGMPAPADLRVGWFDLQPTHAFSPFTPLANYPLAAPAAAAAPAAEPSAVPTEDGVAAAEPDGTAEAAAAPGTQPDAVVTPGTPATAPTASTVTPSTTTPAGSGSVRPDASATITPPPPSPAGSVRPDASTGGSSVRPDAATPTALVETRPPPVDDGKCDDLVGLEPTAMLGKLSDNTITCLEGRLKTTGVQTDKDKISRVLLNNAHAKRDTAAWERLAYRHLTEISQADPDLCLTYASRLQRRGSSRASEAIRWADRALENAHVWPQSVYKERRKSALKVKATAAKSLWESYEAKNVSSPSSENKENAERWRTQTKTYSRDWYDYCKDAGMDTTEALQVCASAAGGRDYCEGG